MRSKKLCYILLSALFIMLGLSLNVYSDTNALQYDLKGIPFYTPYFPDSYITDENGHKHIDWTYDSNVSLYRSDLLNQFNGFRIDLKTSADDESSFSNPSYNFNLSEIPLKFSNGSCSFNNSSSPLISSILTLTNNNNAGNFQSLHSYLPNQFSSEFLSSGTSRLNCRHFESFGTSPQPPFDYSTVDSLLGFQELTPSLNNGLNETVFIKSYFKSLLPDYWTSSSGFYTHDSTTIDGINYKHTFSFDDMFDPGVRSFNYLRIPLWTYDDYWLNGDNFYLGRSLSFQGSFNFNGSFEINPEINNRGGYVKLRLISSPSAIGPVQEFPCSTKTTSIPETNQYSFSYDCSGILNDDYPVLFPSLVFYGGEDSNNNPSYFFRSDSRWSFSTLYFITDNDTTPGGVMGDNLYGSNVLGSAENYVHNEDNADWYSSLINLFNFNMINPFAPIFSLFTSQESCAQIPTLSEFLHSEETQVCPFFSSRIRSVVTPVLGLSSMMLVFGFAVRWLGARSGNFFEDSGSIAPPGDFPAGSVGVKHVGWRRK